MSSKFFTKTLPFWAFGLLASASLLALTHHVAFRFFKKTVATSTSQAQPETARQERSTATFLSLPPCAGTAVGGLVWRDFNNNGVREAGETRVVPGVTVNVFDCNGALIQTTTTDATGTWVVSSGVAVGQQVRVEYCNIPAPFLPSKFGTNNGTTIQFVTVPNCTVDLGVNNPDDFCQTDPKVKIPCFVNGLRSMSGSSPAIVNFQYNGNTVSNDLNFSAIGTAWGLAWDRTTKFMYASAFLKRHSDLGPLGLGGIYKLDYSGGGAPVMSNFYTVPNVGTVVRPADLAGLSDPNVDADAFGKVGKVGLGDIDISPDGNTLWTVNLSTRMLVKISNVLSGTPTSTEIAVGSAPSCASGIFRPFALKFYAGKVWLGGVCTGETGGTSSNLNFSIHSFDPVANTWAMELQHDLFPPNYQHGDIVSSTGECGEFETWADVYDEKNVIVNGDGPADPNGTFERVAPNFRCRGQAWLCDIEFSDAGFMLIAFMDRTGHQLGYVNHRPTGAIPGDMISSNNGGDIVAANKVGATWQLESNGTIPGGGPTSAGGVGNAQGPGGGEFFYQNTGAGHLDNDAGGLVVVSGKNEVLSAVLDPNNVFGGGVNWYNLTTGGTNKSLVVYAPPIGQTGLGKANGLGDMEALCDPQPMELGNYVWHDQNSNGKQDPCELPLAGVNISLFKWNGTKVGSTSSNASGQYYFNNSNVDTLGGSNFTGLRPGTPYYIVIGEGGQFNPGTGKLNNLYSLVTPNQGMGCAADEHDSDGTIMPAGQPGALGALAGYPWYCVPPPPPGSSCHNKDFGFSSCVPITLTMLCDGTTTVPPGGTVNICPGASKMLTIQSTPAGNILWSNGATTATITVSAAGMYSVTVTEPASGCTASQSVTVANPSDPCVCSPLSLSMVCNGTTNVPNGSTVGLCPGASKTLTINATPAGGTILWSNGASIPTITVSATGSYSVTVTNAGGCSKTHSVTVNTTTIGCGPTCMNPTPVKTWHNLTPANRTTLKNGGMVTDFNTGHCYDADGNPATPNPPMLVKITSSAAPNAPTPGVINARLPGKSGDDGFRLGRMMSGTSGVMYCLDFATPTSLLLDSRTHNCLTASEKVIITASYVGNPVALTASMNGVPGPATAMVGGAGNSTATLMANGKQGCGAWWEVHSNQQLVDRICIQYFRTNASEEPGEEPFALKICGEECVTVPPYACAQSNRITRWGSFTNAERMELLGMDNDPDGDGNRVSGFDSGLCDDNGDPVRVHVSGAPAFGPGANTSLINARKPRNWDNGDFFMARQTSGAGTGVTYCFDLDEPSPMELNSREHAYFDSSEHVVVRAWLGPDPVNIVGTLNGTAIAPATVTGSGTPQVVFDANGKKGRGVWWQAATASCVTRVCVSYYRTNAAESPGVEPFQIRACGTSCNPAPPVTCVDPEPITRWNRLTPTQCNSLEDNDMTTNVEDIHTGFCDESGDPIYMDIDIMGAPHAADPNTINNKRCGRWGQTSFNNTRELATNSGTKSCFTFTEAMPACVSSREHQHFTDGERVCVTAYLGNDPVTLTGSLNGPVSTATMSGNNTVEICFNANGEQGDQVWWEVCTGNLPVTTICVEYYRNPGTDAFGNEPFDVQVCNSNRCLFEEKFSCMDPDNPNMNSPSCQEDNLVLTKETFCVKPAASGIAGNVDATFRLKLTNNGTVAVTKLQLEDDLRDHIPANVLVAVISKVFGAGNTAAVNPTFNNGFNGTTDVLLFNGTTGQLNGGQTLVVDLTLELNPSNLPTYGDYANFCFAFGEIPPGRRVTTSSDAPPNTPGNTPPNNPTDATWLWIPSITVAKRAINLTSDCTMQPGDVQFDLEFVIQNTGNVNLDRLTLTENLAGQLGSVFKNIIGSPTIAGSSATINPTLNAGYNGKTNVEVFNGTSGLLAPGQTITVRIRVLADPPTGVGASGCTAAILTNQATVTARGVNPDGTPMPGCDNGEMKVNDKSDTGTTPESQNPGVPGDTGGSDDPTRLPLPSLSVAKHIAGVDCATSGIHGHFDVIFEVILENTGNTDLTNFHLLDNLNSATQYGSAFHAMVQAPHVVLVGAYGTLTNAATNPSVNAGYNGSGDLLAGGGLLHPCERVVVQFRIEVNPEAAGAPANPANSAQGCADAPNFTGGVTPVCDDSDSGEQPESNNPGRPGDTGVACNPTPLTNCHEDAGSPVCNDNVQVSMNEDCLAILDPDDILEGGDDDCMTSNLFPLGSYFDLTVKDAFGNPIPDADPSTPNDFEIGGAYLGQTLTVKVTDVVFKNSCWGTVTLEDKLAPEIFCVNHTLPCTLGVADAPKPIAIDNCTSSTVQQVSQQQIDDDACLGGDVKYRRCWLAVDAYGNQSATCCDTVTIVRPPAPDFPDDVIWTCEQYAAFPNIVEATPLHKFIKDSDLTTPGVIDVFLDPNCDNNSDNSSNSTNTTNGGNGCPGNGLDDADVLGLTGSGIVANVEGVFCMFQVAASDQVLVSCGESFKIVRTWTALDWCTGQIVVTGIGGEDNVQIIKVLDEKPPVIVRPPFTVGANVPGSHPQECASTNLLLPATITDNCNTWTVEIFTPIGEAIYPGNSSGGVNGGFIPAPGLPLGTHTISYVATDACGNEATLNVQVTVIDNDVPAAICDEITDVNLTSDGFTDVFAETFDDGSYDNCCLHHFEVRRMEDPCNDGHDDTKFGSSIVFCCADVGETRTVVFRAVDCAGNTNECMVQVQVSDKVPPVMTNCPQGQRVTCDWYSQNLEATLFGIENNTSLTAAQKDAQQDAFLTPFFGSPTFIDNCIPQITPQVTLNIDQCLEGRIIRTWTAKDAAGNTAQQSCVQTIFVDHVSDFVVEFPLDVTVNCGTTPPDFGEPEIFFETCELVAVSYVDELFTVVPDACYKLVRQWKVINWCVVGAEIDQEVVESSEREFQLAFPNEPCDFDGDGDCDTRTFRDSWRVNPKAKPGASNATNLTGPDTDPDSDPWDGFITYQQVIKVQDTVDPVFTNGCAIPDVCINDNSCVGTIVLPTPQITECSPTVTITAQIQIGGVWMSQGVNGFGPYFNVPPGTYPVRFTAIDNCNNQTVCNSTVKVKDCKLPTPYCKAGIVVELMVVDPPMVVVWAVDLNDNSFDNCPGALKFSFSPNVNVISHTYDCDDFGPNEDTLYVTDAAGNQDFCTTVVNIQANQNQCGGNPHVAGNTVTAESKGVEGVGVSINSTGGFAANAATDATGHFSFGEVPAGGDYSLTPLLDKAPLNGVSTFDLVLISRHILGVQPLGSPYKIIAADANHSGSVTTFDMVELRKLILFIVTDFANNTSWRFVDKAFVFPNPANPFQTSFPEVINLNDLAADALSSDFIAIKVGDVNGSAATNFAGAIEDRNAVGTLVFDAKDASHEAGETFAVDFTARDFAAAGFQFTLNFDPSKLEFVQVGEGVLGAENFGLTLLEEGAIPVSWNGKEGDSAVGTLSANSTSSGNGEVIFSLVFKAKTGVKLSEVLSLGSRFTKAEGYVGANDPQGRPQGSPLHVELAFDGNLANGDFELYQNIPNPFSEQTAIGFHLPEACYVTLTVSDAQGRLVKTVSGEFVKGYNEIRLERKDLPGSGLLNYQLVTPTDSATRKMLRMN